MRRRQLTSESEMVQGTKDSGQPQLESRASFGRFPRPRSFKLLDLAHERTDVSSSQASLRNEVPVNPLRRSPFHPSPLPLSRPYFIGADGNHDGQEQSTADQQRGRNDRNTSATWTDSSLASEAEDEEDRTEFLHEYNRLAQKHGVRKFVSDDYESVDVDTVTMTGKHGSWLMRKLLRRTSSMHTLKTKSDKQLRHKRSISDFSNRLRMRRGPLKNKTLKELVDICGRSLLYLPSDYAAASLSIPTCLRATAHFIVQNGITTRGIFRIPGSNSSILTLYNYYATTDECADTICGTVRAPTLPGHLNYEVHDVASVFKRFLSGLPGGILQGSISLFEALIAIQSHLHSDPEWTRTKQSKVRARLIALAIGSIRSRLQRELICAVFGLLCMIGRAAELAPREDERGRPLPTSGLMGYGALSIIFGPLLLGDVLDSYDMRFAPGGLITFPIAHPALPKDGRRVETQRRKFLDEMSYPASRLDKVKVANGITEMLIVHWRDVVRHMRGLGILKTTKDRDPGLARGRRSLRPYASEHFTLKRPPEWGTEDLSIRQVDPTPSPSPLQRHISQTEPGPGNHLIDFLKIRKRRSRQMAPLQAPILTGSKSMGALSPMMEEPAIEGRSEKLLPTSLSSMPQQTQKAAVQHQVPSNTALHEAAESLKTSPEKEVVTDAEEHGENISPICLSPISLFPLPPRPTFQNRIPSNPALLEAAKRFRTPPKKEETTETSSLLAEVARSLRADAQRLIGVEPDQEESKVAIAELPTNGPAQDIEDKSHVSSPVARPASPLKGTLEKHDKSTLELELDRQISNEHPQESAKLREELSHNLNKDNGGRLRLFRNPSPRSNARRFFEKIEKDANSSKSRSGIEDQVTPSLPESKVPFPSTLPGRKNEEFAASSSVVVKAHLSLPQEQTATVLAVNLTPATVVTINLTPRKSARQYLEKLDQGRASVDKIGTSNKDDLTSPPTLKSGTHSPGIQGGLEPESNTSTQTRVKTPESPLRSESRRFLTPRTGEAVQSDSTSPKHVEEPLQSISAPEGDTPKCLEKPDQIPSPHRFAILRYEKWIQSQGITKPAETQLSPERPGSQFRRPQSLIAGGLRGLVTSDSSSRTSELSELRTAPDAVLTLANAAAQRESDHESSPANSVAKEALERVSHEGDSKSFLVLANAVHPETQDGRRDQKIESNEKSSNSPVPSNSFRMPVKSPEETNDHSAVISTDHIEESSEVEDYSLQNVDERRIEDGPFPSTLDSQCRNKKMSDALNITAISSPNRMPQAIEQISVVRKLSDAASDDSVSNDSASTVRTPFKRGASERPPLSIAGSLLKIDGNSEEVSSHGSDGSAGTVVSPSKWAAHVASERQTLAFLERMADDASNGTAILFPIRDAIQVSCSDAPKDVMVKPDDVTSPSLAKAAPQAHRPKLPKRRPSPKEMGSHTGSVMALAAKFDKPEHGSPMVSPKPVVTPRNLIRPSVFQPADRPVYNNTTHLHLPTKTTDRVLSRVVSSMVSDVVSNYTTNTPSPIKSTYREGSDIGAAQNPFPSDRRPAPQQQQRVTSQKEISPLYRAPRNGRERDSAPSPFSQNKTSQVPLERRSAFDGNNSRASPDTRIPGPHKSTFGTIKNQSSGLSDVERTSSSIRAFLERTSSIGTVLPRPVEPPIDQHIPFIRPPSTPRRMACDEEISRVTTPSGNAGLYEQIRKLQKQLEATTDELARYKRQAESRGNLQDLGTLTEQLRESKREVVSWRCRAELAERRLATLERIKGRMRTISHGDDGTRNGGEAEVLVHDSEVSTNAFFNGNKSRDGKRKPRVLGEATYYATWDDSTDTEVWVRGGTATIVRAVGSQNARDGEEKSVVGDSVMKMRRRSYSESDSEKRGHSEVWLPPLFRGAGTGHGGGDGDSEVVFVEMVDMVPGMRGKGFGKGKRVKAGHDSGSEWSLL